MEFGSYIEQQYTEFVSNFLLPFLRNKYGRALLSLNIENTNISVHCLQSRVKEMGKKGKDTGKMCVTSKEKKYFSTNVTFFKQKDR